MEDNAAAIVESAEEQSTVEPAPDAPLVEELLIEEVSIDGMCGVY